LPLDDFVRGPWETARAADELLTSVTLTPWPGRTAAAYVKFGVHERPTLGVAVALRLEPAANGAASVAEARLAIGCVDPRPARVPRGDAAHGVGGDHGRTPPTAATRLPASGSHK